jgi:hypothetical protein
MPAPAFASIERRMATALMSAFGNIVLTDGVVAFGAVLDNDVESFGEFGLTGERRSRISVLRDDAARFSGGAVLTADPATYSVDEIMALPVSTWKLDRKISDDGHVVSWWLK